MKRAYPSFGSYRFVGALATVLLVPSSGAWAEEPFATGGFKEACALAHRTKRIVLIDFYTTWCRPCKLLDQKTWSDKGVRAWLAKTAVSRKIDAEKETALAARYKIRAYPTILLLKPDGKEIDRLIGYRDPSAFLTEARQALAGQDGVARAKARLNAAGKNRPMERMRYANALVEKGRYAEALTEYLWCLDEGVSHDESFAGVRLSFLLTYIQRLGAKYPPAMDALKKHRDSARAVLAKRSGDWHIAAEFSAYNRVLGQPEQTLSLYDALKSDHADTASAMFDEVSSLLLQKRRYADLIAGAGDIPARVRNEIEGYQRMVSMDHELDQDTRAFMKQHAVQKGSEYYEALVGANKRAEADGLRDQVLAFDKSPATFVTLIQHAGRAGKPKAVQKLVELAKSALSPTDFKQVEQAAK